MTKKTINYQPGYQLSFAEYGDQNGYPILIQHGLIASIDDFDLFKLLIRHNMRLICVARPGYGDSSPYVMESFAEWADIVSPLIHGLGLTQFDILGMSSGAPYAYSLGSRFPENVGNLFIFSGIPALYDEIVLAEWPYEPIRNKSVSDLIDLTHQLFFSNLNEQNLKQNDFRDSMRNNGFGVAQDLRLRFMEWGFRLSDVRAKVFMRHSKLDDAVPVSTAIRTSELLPDCHLELLEEGPHFSKEALNDFILTSMLPNIKAKGKAGKK